MNKTDSHIEVLRMKHADLERKISDEVHRPFNNPARLQELKKSKLRIKDEIERLSMLAA